ncbi:hypothetical protein NDU88_007645 [Pleurodeles waltl]|uniref:Uncharacterized protein n=1 Tax=Pleurodeles waltl TaxID=8319 RepID=A0AAV7N2S8_PLEWA|nr:hypothetical protein NDU88_007645 [Pleurodeles waltl]
METTPLAWLIRAGDTSPSDAAARADTATSNPEGDGSVANSLQLPGPDEERQRRHAFQKFKQWRAWASKKGGESGAGEKSGVDGGREEQQWNEQETNRVEERAESGPEESQVVPVAQEAPCELPSHASGEAWPFQVRPLCWDGKGKGGWEEGAGQD